MRHDVRTAPRPRPPARRGRRQGVAAAALILCVLGGWIYLRPARQVVPVVTLVDRFDTADRRSSLPPDQAFSIVGLTIAGDTRRGIRAHPPSRITWTLVVPARAELRVALGVDPEAWDREGDGVLFRVGVSDDRIYEELLTEYVDPRAEPADRRWIPVTVDLSAYGGRQWSLFYRPDGRRWNLIFNTNPGLPGSTDTRWDWAVWGEPEIVARR